MIQKNKDENEREAGRDGKNARGVRNWRGAKSMEGMYEREGERGKDNMAGISRKGSSTETGQGMEGTRMMIVVEENGSAIARSLQAFLCSAIATPAKHLP